MNILFIGGTGTISSSCLSKALEAGFNVSVLCRGTRNERLPKGVNVFTGDAYDLSPSVSKAIFNTDWDCVVNWTLYNPLQTHHDISRFSNNAGRYFFISSTSVYDDSNNKTPIVESQNYLNTDWFYSKSKINAEKIFLQAYAMEKFPVVIIRPGHTYNDFTVPTNIQGLGYGLIQRIESNKNILMHGDGNSFWTLTHSDDFAKYFVQLFNCPSIEGETFHIASEQHYSWNEIISIYSDLLGKKAKPVHLSAEEINEKSPILGEPILNDKKFNRIFNLSKLKNHITDYQPSTSLHEGLSRVLKWHKDHAEHIRSNLTIENEINKLNI